MDGPGQGSGELIAAGALLGRGQGAGAAGAGLGACGMELWGRAVPVRGAEPCPEPYPKSSLGWWGWGWQGGDDKGLPASPWAPRLS